jgi:hypothetical protein
MEEQRVFVSQKGLCARDTHRRDDFRRMLAFGVF